MRIRLHRFVHDTVGFVQILHTKLDLKPRIETLYINGTSSLTEIHTQNRSSKFSSLMERTIQIGGIQSVEYELETRTAYFLLCSLRLNCSFDDAFTHLIRVLDLSFTRLSRTSTLKKLIQLFVHKTTHNLSHR